MTWIDIIGISYVVGYIAVLCYAVRHRDEPFWRGFLDPYGLRRK